MQRKLTPVFAAVLVTVAVLGQPVAAQNTRLQRQTSSLQRSAASTVPPAPARLDATQKRRFITALAAQRGGASSDTFARLQKGVLTVTKFPSPDLRITPRVPFLATPMMVALGLNGAYQVVSYRKQNLEGYASFFGHPDDVWITLYPQSTQPELYLVDYAIWIDRQTDVQLHALNHPCQVNFQHVQSFRVNRGAHHLLAVIQTQTPAPGPCKLTFHTPANKARWYFYTWEATRLE